jgi:stage II sporulation protein M
MSDLALRTAAAIAVLAFLLTAIAGVAVVINSPSTGKQFIQIVQDQVIGKIDAKEPLSLAIFIFFNNLQACVLLFLGGATLGILTLFIIASNGVIIGGIMELVREERGLLFVAAAILPHGIFEIPSFIISASLGFIVGSSLLAEWHGEGDTGETARAHARTFLLVVVPLVAIAAFIEAFITPQIIHLVS